MEFLSQFKQTTSKLVIKDAKGKPSGLTIDLQAIDSEPVNAVRREIQSENLELSKDDFTPEKQEVDNRRIYAAAIVDWTWAKGLTLNGTENPDCDDTNKLAILKTPYVFKQIDRFLAKDENFLQGSQDT
jgi:hypothetical protein